MRAAPLPTRQTYVPVKAGTELAKHITNAIEAKMALDYTRWSQGWRLATRKRQSAYFCDMLVAGRAREELIIAARHGMSGNVACSLTHCHETVEGFVDWVLSALETCPVTSVSSPPSLQ